MNEMTLKMEWRQRKPLTEWDIKWDGTFNDPQTPRAPDQQTIIMLDLYVGSKCVAWISADSRCYQINHETEWSHEWETIFRSKPIHSVRKDAKGRWDYDSESPTRYRACLKEMKDLVEAEVITFFTDCGVI